MNINEKDPQIYKCITSIIIHTDITMYLHLIFSSLNNQPFNHGILRKGYKTGISQSHNSRF